MGPELGWSQPEIQHSTILKAEILQRRVPRTVPTFPPPSFSQVGNLGSWFISSPFYLQERQTPNPSRGMFSPYNTQPVTIPTFSLLSYPIFPAFQEASSELQLVAPALKQALPLQPLK